MNLHRRLQRLEQLAAGLTAASHLDNLICKDMEWSKFSAR